MENLIVPFVLSSSPGQIGGSSNPPEVHCGVPIRIWDSHCRNQFLFGMVLSNAFVFQCCVCVLSSLYVSSSRNFNKFIIHQTVHVRSDVI